MPQVDKVTFFPIVFWMLTLYVGGYIMMNLTVFLQFFSSMKTATKRATTIHTSAMLTQRAMNPVMVFPWVSL